MHRGEAGELAVTKDDEDIQGTEDSFLATLQQEDLGQSLIYQQNDIKGLRTPR